MILAIGSSGEKTISYFVEKANEAGVTVAFFDTRRLLGDCGVEVTAGQGDLRIRIDDDEYDLSKYNAIYSRAMCAQRAPAPKMAKIGIILDQILGFLNFSDQLIVNRPVAGIENSSKLVQLWKLKEIGFKVPATILTNSSKFAERTFLPDGRWISKGCSGMRTIADILDVGRYSRLAFLDTVPVLMQRFIRGVDIRLNYICGEIVALRIESREVDYRYADRSDLTVSLQTDIPLFIQHAVRHYCQNAGLNFSGLDFKIDKETGEWYVLEANPMPGFDYFDKMVGGAIVKCLLRQLDQDRSLFPKATSAAPRDHFFIEDERRPEVNVF